MAQVKVPFEAVILAEIKESFGHQLGQAESIFIPTQNQLKFYLNSYSLSGQTEME